MKAAMKTIPLEYPIQMGGVEVTELRMRRLKWKDIRLAEKHSTDETEQVTFLLTQLCSNMAGTSLCPDDIDQLDIADIEPLSKTIEDFTKRRK